ncbi:hypothetical protein AvCA_17750 [Azotobacter vinelandii CA]|uniref:Uncharacterized protein n=2 Tax=Azotobacter vinelandii TaxID=354 RepID=C1DDL7_AZOVD|nr:hypothetical protein Avin_17750 [Azotobacter vinelandii DJ]AGK15187.1 hypothetical protein AvCA_17750 [Azotobacter vinelandii CA]AGK20148.1 hypothetical protein AvCA6_17750 [Azotobacter vinelandii CA6]
MLRLVHARTPPGRWSVSRNAPTARPDMSAGTVSVSATPKVGQTRGAAIDPFCVFDNGTAAPARHRSASAVSMSASTRSGRPSVRSVRDKRSAWMDMGLPWFRKVAKP